MSARLAAAVDQRRYQPISRQDEERNNPVYNGAYGRDGAPSDRVVAPLRPAYQPTPSPNGLYVDTSRDTSSRPLYSPGGTYQSSNTTPPPSYSDHDGNRGKHLAAPPKAAFVEPRSPRSPASPSNQHFTDVKGPEVQWEESVQEKAAKGFRGDEEPPAFWKRMSGMAKQGPGGSVWLKQQQGKKRGFKTTAWVIAVLVLGAIAGGVAYHILGPKSNNGEASEPSAISWANGASNIPTIFATPTSTPTPAVRVVKKRHFGAGVSSPAH